MERDMSVCVGQEKCMTNLLSSMLPSKKKKKIGTAEYNRNLVLPMPNRCAAVFRVRSGIIKY